MDYQIEWTKEAREDYRWAYKMSKDKVITIRWAYKMSKDKVITIRKKAPKKKSNLALGGTLSMCQKSCPKRI
jgi:hypothetical protein